ncbi:MAG: radical SAM protein, partial [Candidatus ainarchaeum sp.]|nr:radical SAM protein [Candidatus ainarchaeum sp.]
MNTRKKKILEFFKNINTQKITKQEFEKKKVDFARENKLKQLPLTSEILDALNIKTPPSFLVTKPTKTLSGVTVIAVMTKPGDCPGKCIYCPNSEIAPRSYTGFEPAAMRAKRNDFDPYKQIKDRLHQFEATGHPTNKIELIVMGGTFPAMPYKYQKEFMIKVYQALTDSKNEDLETLKKIASKSKRRVVGITFETRPDFCNKKIIKRLLEFGGTRVEIGVQILNDKILDYVNRGHRIDAVIKATEELKDAGFKVLYHFMLALPNSTPKKDI